MERLTTETPRVQLEQREGESQIAAPGCGVYGAQVSHVVSLDRNLPKCCSALLYTASKSSCVRKSGSSSLYVSAVSVMGLGKLLMRALAVMEPPEHGLSDLQVNRPRCWLWYGFEVLS
jgi:hypothetical protein